MNITRQHYEEYFLLYVDNELNEADRKAVEDFVQQNPDLAEELRALQETVISPDHELSFEHKSDLLKAIGSENPVNETNYEEYFVLYGDDELTREEKDHVGQFVYNHPQYMEEFELILRARLEPDKLVYFPDKEVLYRGEKAAVRPLVRWLRYAAAIMIGLFMISYLGVFLSKKSEKTLSDVVVDTKTYEQSPLLNDTNAKKSVIDQRKVDSASQGDRNIAEKETITPVAPVVAEKANNSSSQSVRVNSPANKTTHPEKTYADVNSKQATTTVGTGTKETVGEKTSEESNALAASDVTHKEAIEKGMVKGVTEKITVKPTTAKALADKPADVANSLALSGEDELDADQFATASNKKNRMRGLFRKVSRVFERNTNLEPGENNRAIRIASFEIALK